MKALIAGSGIGGLTCALMLHDRGIAVEVYEQATSIRELGVGINVLPQAIAELARIGLLGRLDDVAVRTSELYYLNRFGQEVWREPRGIAAGHLVPQFSIHRGRLQAVLLEAVLARLGAGAVHVNHRLHDFEQDEQGVTPRFVDRSGTELEPATGDALIGADGIHSYVRSRLVPDEGPPLWNGVMLWRGCRDWPVFLDGRSMIVAGGPASKVVLYPVGAGETAGTRLTNWAVLGRKEGAGRAVAGAQDWSRTGRWEDVVSQIDGYGGLEVDLAALISGTETFWEYPMSDRDPLATWTNGRVTLLGDAAHPMYPVGSNGASQAILDARALADALARYDDDPVRALAGYESARLPVTTEIVRGNRLGGPEGVIDAVNAIAPEGFDDVEAVLPRAEREAIVRTRAGAATVVPTAESPS
jgi:2-polyprenyl-6-methoxyphenol hydroxylase-like FAD-dependent oxidoreductase